MKPQLEKTLRKKVKNILENMLKENNPKINQITYKINNLCEEMTDTLDPSEQMQVYMNVASFLQNRVLDIKKNSI